ncbi:MAG: hypothetical protein AAF974_03790 [Cyanobacteria bacterium P01_E01_bin.34]
MAGEASGMSGNRFNLVRFLGAKMWREAEQEAIANRASSEAWSDKRYWELEFKTAFEKCEQYNIPESDLKLCTSERFWGDVERLARQKMCEDIASSEQDYWSSVLAKALSASNPNMPH